MPSDLEAVHVSSLSLDGHAEIPEMWLRRSERICVVGGSDTGKTRFAMHCLGLLQSSEADSSNRHDPERSAFVPPQPSLLFSGIKSTLAGELELTFQFLGMKIPNDLSAYVDHEFATELKRDPFSFSGGQTAKLAVSMVAAKQPQLWVLDQAFDSLSIAAKLSLSDFLEKARKRGAIILETHARLPPWVEQVSRCIFLSKHGKPVIGRYNEVSRTRLSFPMWTPEIRLQNLKASREYLISQSPRQKESSFPEIANRQFSISALNMYFEYNVGIFRLGPVSFRVGSGDSIGIIGENGAGKSTLLKLLSGLIEPSSGEVKWHDNRFSKAQVSSKKIMYCFQNPDEQIYRATTRDEIFLNKSKSSLVPAWAMWLIDRLGLSEDLGRTPADLSLSKRRLLNIASIFAAAPSCIALDEPTAYLDDEEIMAVLDVIRQYQLAGGTLLTISHDSDFLGEICTRLFHIQSGRLDNVFDPADWPNESKPFALRASENTSHVTTSLYDLIFRFN